MNEPTAARSVLRAWLAPAGLATLSLLFALPAGAELSQGLRTDYPVGSAPYGVAIADFDGDGLLDIASISYTLGAVNLLLADGPGRFGPARYAAAGDGPRGIASADLNGDGRPDVVTANQGANTVTVLLGSQRAGTFFPKADYECGQGPRSVALGDLNGDGAADIVVTNYFAGGVTVLLNGGRGVFGGRVSYPVGLGPTAVAVGDVNGDGHMDLAVTASAVSSLAILLGDGRGHFAPRRTYPIGTSANGVTIGDVNGDGRPDVVTANTGPSTVSVLYGNDSGTLSGRRDYVTGLGPNSVVIHDMNGDGLADILTSNGRAGSVTFLLADGMGGFLPNVDFETGSQPTDVAVAEMSGDGRPDFVTSNSALSTVSVNVGTFAGAMGIREDFPIAGGPVALQMGDTNGDGFADIAMALHDANQVVVLRGDGQGGFGSRIVLGTGAGPFGLALGDLNLDGVQDLAVTNSDDGTVSLFRGNRAGGFEDRVDLVAGAAPSAVAIGNVVGDLLPDLVVVNQASSSISLFMGVGNGQFASPSEWSVGSTPRDVALGDLNTDGYLDVIVATFNVRALTILPNNQGAGFGAPITKGVSTRNPIALATARLNDDNFLDVAVAGFGGDMVSVLFGNGAGGFGAGVDLPTGAGTRAVTIADVNADGRPDIITANSVGSSVSVMLGDGNGEFTSHADFAIEGYPLGVVATDLRGASDVPLEIITANRDASTFSVLHPRWRTSTTLIGAPGPSIAGEPVTLTAAVSSSLRDGSTPSGTVQFFDGTRSLGVTPLADTLAVLTTSVLGPGPRSIRAVYSGDLQRMGSASAEWTTHVYRCGNAPTAVSTSASAFESGEIRIEVGGVPRVSSVRFGTTASGLVTATPTSFMVDSAAIRVTALVPGNAISGPVQLDGPCGTVTTSNIVEVRRAFALSTGRVDAYGCLSGVGWSASPALGDTSGFALGSLGLNGREDYDWRVREWDPEAQDYRAVDRLRVGRGYWIQTRVPWNTSITGSVARDTTLVLPLPQRGWYLFGNPFPGPVPIANLRVLKNGVPREFLRQTDVQSTVFVWNPGARRYAATTEIPAGAMFWVRRLSFTAAESLLVPPPGPGAPGGPGEPGSAPEWSARLSVRQGEQRSEDVTIGFAVLPDSAQHARTAMAPPPAPASGLSLGIRRTAGTESEAYGCLVLDRNEPPVWDIEIENVESPGELQLDAAFDRLPGDAWLQLSDPANGLAERLEPGRSLTLAALSGRRTLRLEVLRAPGAPPPATVERVRAYPSPFAATTGFWFAHPQDGDVRVTLFDVAGRRVRSLERSAAPAGENVLVWDGRDEQGARVPAAVYFARCEIGAWRRLVRVVRIP